MPGSQTRKANDRQPNVARSGLRRSWHPNYATGKSSTLDARTVATEARHRESCSGASAQTAPAEAPGSAIFVTPDGSWVRAASSEFYGLLGDADPDYDASLYAIKNFGFIRVRILEESLVHIELHAQDVTTAALFSIQNFLSSLRFNSVRITYLKDIWTSEIVSSAKTAICRLSEICTLEDAESAYPN